MQAAGNRKPRSARSWLLAMLVGYGACWVMGSASAQSAGCNRACTDYLRPNAAAQPLTRARIDASAGALRAGFIAYLDASNLARDQDKAALRAERQGLSTIPAARSSDSSGTDSMPLDRPPAYYASPEALAIAREIVSFQVPSGGWGKNMRRTGVVRARGQSYITDAIDPNSSSADKWRYVGTIDNGATFTEIRYLAKVQAAQATDRAAIRASIVRGLDYLLRAQYPNGGWPQIHPLAGGYNDAITLNDDAMLNVVRLLNEVGTGSDAAFVFVEQPLRDRARAAANRGVAWFLDRQVTIGGRRTLWAQQHDALGQAPTSARAYEMPALAAAESAKIVDFLMTIANPDARVRAAVHDAAAFFITTRLAGKRYNRTTGTLDNSSGNDAWARFYDLGAYDPGASDVARRARALFGDRPEPHDSSEYGLVFGSLVSVSMERRTGYAQYGNAPHSMLTRYETWRQRNPR